MSSFSKRRCSLGDDCQAPDKELRPRYKCHHCGRQLHSVPLGCSDACGDDNGKVMCRQGFGCKASPNDPTHQTTAAAPAGVAVGATASAAATSKPRRQSTLNQMGFYQKLVDPKTQKVFSRQLDEPVGKVEDPNLKCCGCQKCFLNMSGLRSHELHCQNARALKKEKEEKEQRLSAPRGFAFHPHSDTVSDITRARRQEEQHSAVQVSHVVTDNKPGKVDGRANNRGAALRNRHTNEFKYKHIMHCEMWLQDHHCRTVADYCREFHPTETGKWQGYLSKANWRKEETRERIVYAVSNKLHAKYCTTTSTGSQRNSPFAKMEMMLCQEIQSHRLNKRKVSRHWICCKARKLQLDLDRQNGTSLGRHFKASRGWFHRFLR